MHAPNLKHHNDLTSKARLRQVDGAWVERISGTGLQITLGHEYWASNALGACSAICRVEVEVFGNVTGPDQVRRFERGHNLIDSLTSWLAR